MEGAASNWHRVCFESRSTRSGVVPGTADRQKPLHRPAKRSRCRRDHERYRSPCWNHPRHLAVGACASVEPTRLRARTGAHPARHGCDRTRRPARLRLPDRPPGPYRSAGPRRVRPVLPLRILHPGMDHRPPGSIADPACLRHPHRRPRHLRPALPERGARVRRVLPVFLDHRRQRLPFRQELSDGHGHGVHGRLQHGSADEPVLADAQEFRAQHADRAGGVVQLPRHPPRPSDRGASACRGCQYGEEPLHREHESRAAHPDRRGRRDQRTAPREQARSAAA